MRCSCCNRALNDYESTLKSAQTNEYLDTCMKCLKDLDIATIGRSDLSPFAEDDEENEFEFEDEDDGIFNQKLV